MTTVPTIICDLLMKEPTGWRDGDGYTHQRTGITLIFGGDNMPIYVEPVNYKFTEKESLRVHKAMRRHAVLALQALIDGEPKPKPVEEPKQEPEPLLATEEAKPEKTKREKRTHKTLEEVFSDVHPPSGKTYLEHWKSLPELAPLDGKSSRKTIEETCEIAWDHKARRKCTAMPLYLLNWLKNEAQRARYAYERDLKNGVVSSEEVKEGMIINGTLVTPLRCTVFEDDDKPAIPFDWELMRRMDEEERLEAERLKNGGGDSCESPDVTTSH